MRSYGYQCTQCGGDISLLFTDGEEAPFEINANRELFHQTSGPRPGEYANPGDQLTYCDGSLVLMGEELNTGE